MRHKIISLILAAAFLTQQIALAGPHALRPVSFSESRGAARRPPAPNPPVKSHTLNAPQSGSNYDGLLKAYLEGAGFTQIWGEPKEGAAQNASLKNRLAALGWNLPGDVDIVLVEHNNGGPGSVESNFIYFSREKADWMFSRVSNPFPDGRRTLLITKPAFLELIDSGDPQKIDFIKRIFMCEEGLNITEFVERNFIHSVLMKEIAQRRKDIPQFNTAEPRTLEEILKDIYVSISTAMMNDRTYYFDRPRTLSALEDIVELVRPYGKFLTKPQKNAFVDVVMSLIFISFDLTEDEKTMFYAKYLINAASQELNTEINIEICYNAYIFLANTYLRNARAEEAVETLEHVYIDVGEVDEDFYNLYIMALGKAYVSLPYVDEDALMKGITMLRTVLNKISSDCRAEILSVLGIAYLKLGQIQNAERACAALEKDPDAAMFENVSPLIMMKSMQGMKEEIAKLEAGGQAVKAAQLRQELEEAGSRLKGKIETLAAGSPGIIIYPYERVQANIVLGQYDEALINLSRLTSSKLSARYRAIANSLKGENQAAQSDVSELFEECYENHDLAIIAAERHNMDLEKDYFTGLVIDSFGPADISKDPKALIGAIKFFVLSGDRRGIEFSRTYIDQAVKQAANSPWARAWLDNVFEKVCMGAPRQAYVAVVEPYVDRARSDPGLLPVRDKLKRAAAFMKYKKGILDSRVTFDAEEIRILLDEAKTMDNILDGQRKRAIYAAVLKMFNRFREGYELEKLPEVVSIVEENLVDITASRIEVPPCFAAVIARYYIENGLIGKLEIFLSILTNAFNGGNKNIGKVFPYIEQAWALIHALDGDAAAIQRREAMLCEMAGYPPEKLFTAINRFQFFGEYSQWMGRDAAALVDLRYGHQAALREKVPIARRNAEHNRQVDLYANTVNFIETLPMGISVLSCSAPARRLFFQKCLNEIRGGLPKEALLDAEGVLTVPMIYEALLNGRPQEALALARSDKQVSNVHSPSAWISLLVFSDMYYLAESSGLFDAQSLRETEGRIETAFEYLKKGMASLHYAATAGVTDVIHCYSIIAKGRTAEARTRLNELLASDKQNAELIKYLLAMCGDMERDTAACRNLLKDVFSNEIWSLEFKHVAMVHSLNLINRQAMDEAIASLINDDGTPAAVRENAIAFAGLYSAPQTAAPALKTEAEKALAVDVSDAAGMKRLAVCVQALLATGSKEAMGFVEAVERRDEARRDSERLCAALAGAVPLYDETVNVLRLKHRDLLTDPDTTRVSAVLEEMRKSLTPVRLGIISSAKAKLLLEVEILQGEIGVMTGRLSEARKLYEEGKFDAAYAVYREVGGRLYLKQSDLANIKDMGSLRSVAAALREIDFSNLEAAINILSAQMKALESVTTYRNLNRLRSELGRARVICNLCVKHKLSAAQKEIGEALRTFRGSTPLARLNDAMGALIEEREKRISTLRAAAERLDNWTKYASGMAPERREEFLTQLYAMLDMVNSVLEVDLVNEEALTHLRHAIDVAFSVHEYPMTVFLAEACLKTGFDPGIRDIQINALVKLNYDIVNGELAAEEARDERLQREYRSLYWEYRKLKKVDTGFTLSEFSNIRKDKRISDIFTVGDTYLITQLRAKGMTPKFRVVDVDNDTGEVRFELSEIRNKKVILSALPLIGTIERLGNSPLVLQKNLLSNMNNSLEASSREMAGSVGRGSRVKAAAGRHAPSSRGPTLGQGRPIDILLGVARNVWSATDIASRRRKLKEQDLFDRRIFHDDSQRQAVESGISMDIPVSLVQGPPGTGKTTVIREMVRQLVKQGRRILVVSQSNAAVDNVGKGFFRKVLDEKGIEKIEEFVPFVRVGNDGEVVGGDLLWNWVGKKDTLGKFAKFENGKGYVVLGTNMGFATDEDVKKNGAIFKEFDVVIMDESSRATLGETLYPLSCAAKKIIMVGDHKQLPPYGIDEQRLEMIHQEVGFGLHLERPYPYIFSDEAIDMFKISPFEMAYEHSPGVDRHFLSVAYRFHPAIAGLVSIDYGGRIAYDHRKPTALTPYTIRVIDTQGRCPEERIGEGRLKNTGEINLLLRKIDDLLNLRGPDGEYLLNPEDITIITPYRLQISEIKSALRLKALNNEKLTRSRPLSQDEIGVLNRAYARYDLRKYGRRSFGPRDIEKFNLEVATVDSFMGSENKAVEVVHVRSNSRGDIGFVADHNRGTVMYSRAQDMLGLTMDARTFINAGVWVPSGITDKRRLARLKRRQADVIEARSRFLRKLKYITLIYAGVPIDEALNRALTEPVSRTDQRSLLEAIQSLDSRARVFATQQAQSPAAAPKEPDNMGQMVAAGQV